MTTYVKDIQEIPNLKPPQETFVDDPQSLNEIHLEELNFDLVNGLKKFDNLHILHAIYMLAIVTRFTIILQKQPELYQKFRRQQLNKWGIDIESSKEQSGGVCRRERERERVNVDGIGGDDPTDELFANIDGVEDDRTASASSASSSSSDLSKSSEERGEIMDEAILSQDESELEDVKHVGEANTNEKDDISVFQDENIDDIHFKSSPTSYSSSTTLSTTLLTTLSQRHQLSVQPPSYIPVEKLLQNTNLNKRNIPVTSNHKKLTVELQHANRAVHHHPQHHKHLVKIFNLIKLPNLSIEQFLLRINQYSNQISLNAYLHSIFIIYKITILLDLFTLNDNNCFRLIIGSLRTSIKLLDDVYQKQSSFKNVVGCNAKDLLKIEIGFLYLVNFNMNLEMEEEHIKRFLQDDFNSLCIFMKNEMSQEYNLVVQGFQNLESN